MASSMSNLRFLAAALSVACVLTAPVTAVAGAPVQPVRYPLETPDLSSPHATLANFMTTMDEAFAYLKAQGQRSFADRAERAARVRRILGFLDLEKVAPSLRRNTGREAVACLKETLDRIELPPWSEVPDADQIAALPGGLAHWTIPHTEITLTRIAAGPRAGQYVFSAETVDRAEEFYRRVKHLPYRAGATEGLYESYVSSPGWMIPAAWIRGLPGWLRARGGGQAVWQWGGLVVTLLLAPAVMLLLYRTGGRWAKHGSGARFFLALAFPVLAMLVPALADGFISDQLFISGRVFAVTEFALNLLGLGALVLIVLGTASRLAAAVGRLPWFRPRGVDAHLARLVVRVAGVAAAVITLFEGGRYLGVPVGTLVAGASVSGLAVALAAQDSLRNLFGSLAILLDHPFRVGDQIRVKNYEGVVEDIGLRSTKIRLANGHLASIANEEMARLDTENISRRPYLRRSDTIRLAVDTPPDKVQRAVGIIRDLLRDHAGSVPTLPPRVQVGSVDGVALTLTMVYWFHPPDPLAFAAFNEHVSLHLLEQFRAEGIRMV